VQIVYSSRRGSRDIEHIGSAHDDADPAVLKAAAQQRMAAEQGELDLGLESIVPATRAGGPLPITSAGRPAPARRRRPSTAKPTLSTRRSA
jgi:hypothetical protein